MSKEREKIPNNIKSFIESNLTPVQIEALKSTMSDGHSINERLIGEDIAGWPVPAWRQLIWSSEISKASGKPVVKEYLFPLSTDDLDIKLKSQKKEKVK